MRQLLLLQLQEAGLGQQQQNPLRQLLQQQQQQQQQQQHQTEGTALPSPLRPLASPFLNSPLNQAQPFPCPQEPPSQKQALKALLGSAVDDQTLDALAVNPALADKKVEGLSHPTPNEVAPVLAPAAGTPMTTATAVAAAMQRLESRARPTSYVNAASANAHQTRQSSGSSCYSKSQHSNDGSQAPLSGSASALTSPTFLQDPFNHTGASDFNSNSDPKRAKLSFPAPATSGINGPDNTSTAEDFSSPSCMEWQV